MPDFDVKSVVTTPQGVGKSGICFSWMLAFTRVTGRVGKDDGRGRVAGDGSFMVGDFSRF